MKLVNLTPHAVRVHLQWRDDPDRVIDLPKPAVAVPRVAVTRTPERPVLVGKDAVPVTRAVLGEVEDLPPEQPGTIYIVSALVQQATPERTDLLSPGEAVRNDKGYVVGCLGLSRVV